MSTYKKLTNTNVASIPFNAHKLWSFTSASATNESIGIVMESARYTSASLHTYSSASTDLSSSVKYHQTDHLFYKDFQKNVNNKFGNIHYLTQQRELYDNLNTISIPSGIYGMEIKPGTFSFSGSAGTTIVDDKKGNLIISGTDLTNHNTDVRKKILHVGPTKGFKQYDLKSQFYRVKEDPNDISRYFSKDEVSDDSYYSNSLSFKNVTFSEEILGPEIILGRDFNNGTQGWNVDTAVTIISGSGSNALMVGGDINSLPYFYQSSDTETDGLIPGQEYEVNVNIISSSIPSGHTDGTYLSIHNHAGGGVQYSSEYISITENLNTSPPSNGFYKKRWIANRKQPYFYVGPYDHKVLIDSVSVKKVDAFPSINFENNITKGDELVLNGDFALNDGAEDFTSWIAVDDENVVTRSPIPNGIRIDYSGTPSEPYLPRIYQAVGDRMEVGKTYKFEYEVRGNVNSNFYGRISNHNGSKIQSRTPLNFMETHRFKKFSSVFKCNFTIDTPSEPGGPLWINFHPNNVMVGGEFFEVRNVTLKEVDPTAHSSIVTPHKDDYNFNPEDDFTVSMYVNPYNNAGNNQLYQIGNNTLDNESVIINQLPLSDRKSYLISKSTTKTIIPTPLNTRYGRMALNATGSAQPKEVPVDAQYPFEIYIEKITSTNDFAQTNNQNVVFTKTDGDFTPLISASIATGSFQHLVCMTSASRMEIWLDGVKVASGSDTTVKRTQNTANLYIGSKGEQESFFSGSMSNLMIFNEAKSSEQITNIKDNFNNSPYVGNIFYSQGMATITHPKYQYIAKPGPNSNNSGSFNSIKFNGSHTIYENEFQCTVEAHEYNYSNNVSTRKIQTDQHANLDGFATGSIWAPYVTTIGLYDDNHELLVVGKLGQPIKMSGETDTTLVIKWDT
jgi:hypothetical protein